MPHHIRRKQATILTRFQLPSFKIKLFLSPPSFQLKPPRVISGVHAKMNVITSWLLCISPRPILNSHPPHPAPKRFTKGTKWTRTRNGRVINQKWTFIHKYITMTKLQTLRPKVIHISIVITFALNHYNKIITFIISSQQWCQPFPSPITDDYLHSVLMLLIQSQICFWNSYHKLLENGSCFLSLPNIILTGKV